MPSGVLCVLTVLACRTKYFIELRRGFMFILSSGVRSPALVFLLVNNEVVVIVFNSTSG